MDALGITHSEKHSLRLLLMGFGFDKINCRAFIKHSKMRCCTVMRFKNANKFGFSIVYNNIQLKYLCWLNVI